MAKLKKVPVPKAKKEYKKGQRWAKARQKGGPGLSQVTGPKGRKRTFQQDFPGKFLMPRVKINRPLKK